MEENIILKMLCSIPIILVLLYFIPFLGICLMLFRCFLYKNKKSSIYYIEIICGLLILIPQIIDIFKIKSEIFQIETILNSDIYIKLLNYSKLLITVGIIFLVLSYIFKYLFNKIDNKISDYIKEEQNRDYKIRKENDMKMQEKREKAKNTHVVYCPYCGSDNMISEKTGICKYCRRQIEYKEKES